MVKLKLCVSLPLVLVLFYDCCCRASVSLTDVQNVFDNIILPKDHRYRPLLVQNQPIVVNISLELVSLVDVDEVHQTLSTNVLLTLTWKDEFRTWRPDQYGGLTSVSPDPLEVWRPRLFVSNTVAERDMFKDDYAPLIVFSDGTTVWQPGGILHTSCPMPLARYPFDKHNCQLTFSTGETTDEIAFVHDSDDIFFDFYEKNGEWDLWPSRMVVISVNRSLETLPRLSFNFQIQRKVSFAILCVLMPVIVISFLTALVFITPVESGERVTFSITVFLSLTFSTEQMSGNFPKNSESLPLLIIYLACLLMHSSLAVCVNLFVLLKENRRYRIASAPAAENASSRYTSESNLAKSFESFNDKLELDEIYTSEGSRQGRYRHDQRSRKSPPAEQDKTLANVTTRKERGRFGSLGKQQRSSTSKEDAAKSEDSSKRPPRCKMPLLLKHMNQNDMVLFIVFSTTWFLLAVVFIVIQTGDLGKQ